MFAGDMDPGRPLLEALSLLQLHCLPCRVEMDISQKTYIHLVRNVLVETVGSSMCINKKKHVIMHEKAVEPDQLQKKCENPPFLLYSVLDMVPCR
mmetsp:Transcript_3522/g.8116  ORF Transcript_3522/g.8116 Transcript_3522/m.8116 type:complete len:95 (+) Transcript_3522:153-437(+)